ncbi:MAG TPA: SDR family NAD(P)-dependent oxidoreductase, partial [Longimicrobium sp.]|nr:SDR family NAD(P)-dependent oxidoreductase [Longimicrobium sp.]
ASVAALAVLDALAIQAEVAVGHSLGELVALHWAGAMDRDALLRTAAVRGAAMGALNGTAGAMASLGASRAEVEALLSGSGAVVAGVNAPRRTVVAGAADAVSGIAERARSLGWEVQRLRVSHAFHSPLVAAAAEPLAEHLAAEALDAPRRRVSSTVLGRPLEAGDDPRGVLVRQVTAPVLFLDALRAVRDDVDLWIEAGPGHALSTLAAETVDAPVVALDACGPSLGGLLRAAAAAWTLGAPVRLEALYADRFARPIDLSRRPRFLANPCELAPVDGGTAAESESAAALPDADGSGLGSGSGSGGSGSSGSTAGGGSALEVVRVLVAERTELPIDAVLDDHRLLGDLHLNSITVGEIVARAARRLGLAPPAAPTEYATATVAGVARALAELAATGAAAPAEEAEDADPPGLAPWVRAFTVELVESPLPPAVPVRGGERGEGDGWRVIAPADHPLVEPLRAALANAGEGIAVCLPADADERHLGLLMEGARAVLAADGPTRFLLAQQGGGGGAGFARSLALEAPRATVCVVDLPAEVPEAARWAAEEARAARGYTEAHYDAAGHRRVPRLRLAPPSASAALPLGPDDVLLATGGGKGITAECALALARESGAALVLLGTALPGRDAALDANLERFAAAGVRARYFAADVTDADAVRRAVRAAEAEFGPVTAVVHGAAVNVPRLIASLDEAALAETLAPKLAGLRGVLAAVDPARLRLLVGFGSIIARTGMAGEAGYALANEWLARDVARFGAAHPHCRALTVEWSVWSGVGMGARLGALDALARAGVSPVPPDEGARILRRLLADPAPPSAVVVAGRFGAPPALPMDRPDLPLLRFLEHPRVHYPGVELVADAELSTATDPYLDDHVVRGERLLPAVLGLEAMAQAARALAGTEAIPVFEDVRFERPVVVPAEGAMRVRLCALLREDGAVDVALRSDATGFAADHFRALCRFGTPMEEAEDGGSGAWRADDGGEVAVDPERELYGGIFFHGGRFRRVAGYRRLRARECEAVLSPGGDARWFGAYLPPARLLGDAGARDAALHAIQACIPHALVLPVAVARMIPGVLDPASAHLVRAREVEDDGQELVYDVEVCAPDGAVRERWTGLRLRRVARLEPAEGWAPALLGPYLERRVAELVPGAAVSVAVERGGGDRQAASDRANGRAAGVRVPVRRRPDGRPELLDLPLAVSAAHCGELTLGVAGLGPLGCDLERVTPRPASLWRDLLGADGFRLAEEIARQAGEELDAAATRVWSARECLRKAGLPHDAPLVIG